MTRMGRPKLIAGTRRWLQALIVLSLLFGYFTPFVNPLIPTASAHNLDTRMVSMYFDPATQLLINGRVNNVGNPLVQSNDVMGMIIKVVPTDGTTTGVGGYIDFYVPNGVTVLDAAYVQPNGSGGYKEIPMKGQALMPDVGAGGGPAIDLTGISRGPNIAGQTGTLVTAGNVNLGTLPGIYGDIGIFYATAPETAYGSYSGGTIKNNSGDTSGLRTSFGYPLNKWDAWQMAAYGIKATTNPAYPSAPLIDSNGRGNAGWGLAGGVPGPESGYAWSFNKDVWDANGGLSANARADAALVTGPWKRIQFPGSQIANDPPGGTNSTPHAGGMGGGTFGFDLKPSTPLPSTTSQTDSVSPKAIRWSIGQTTLHVPEYVWVQFRVDSTAAILNASGCPVFRGDTFGGDAGGESGGKDHLWRYYDPTEIVWDACVSISKAATKSVVKVGENFQYKVVLYNSGQQNLTNVVVTDDLPGGVNFLSAVPAQSSGPGPLVWTIGNLNVGQKFEATVTVQAKSTGALENNICMSSSQLPQKCAKEVTPAGNIVVLSQDKTASPTTVVPSGSIQYTIQIDNSGTAATGSPLKIEEMLPPGFSYTSLTSVTANGASLTGSTAVNSSDPNRPSFTVPTAINAGQSLVLKFTSTVGASVTSGLYCNSFTSTQNAVPLTTGSLACVTVGGGRIGDTVFRDWNNDGVQNSGEEGMTGVTVSLNGGAQTAVTGANGAYLFSGLNAGTYSVAVSAGIPAGYTLTTANNPANVTLAANEQRLNVDFGYRPGGTGSIGDLVYKDIANDGIFNGSDAGIGNVTVWLHKDSNGNGAIDLGDLKVMTATTNGSGIYGFSGLATGLSYIVDVDESDPDLVAAFTPNAFVNSTPALQPVSNLSGSYLSADFGFFPNLPNSIGDQVFVDTNSNGIYNNGEPLLPAITVNLYRDANSNGVAETGELAQTTSTNITGTYAFNGLGPDNYIVVVDSNDPDIPGGYTPTIRQFQYTLTTNQSIVTADFPFVSLISKTVDKTKVNLGAALRYTITINYPGSQLLSNVTVTDTVPAGATYAGNASPAPASQPGIGGTGTVQWNLGSNAAGVPGTTTGATQCTATLVPSADTYLNNEATSQTHGSNTTFSVEGENNKLKRALLKFDLSSLAGGTISAASLRLQKVSGDTTAYDVNVHALLNTTPAQGWTEAGATWTNYNAVSPWTTAGAIDDLNASIVATRNVSAIGPYTWTITSLVQGWLSGSANNGMVLRGSPEQSGNQPIFDFSSKEGSTPPQLIVTGVFPNGCSSSTILPVSSDTYLRKDQTTNNFGSRNLMETNPGINGAQNSERQGLIKFDLSSIPSGATVTGVSLRMNNTGSRSDHILEVREALVAWNEGAQNGGVCSAPANGAAWNDPDCVGGLNGWNGVGGDYRAATAPWGTTLLGSLNASTTGQKTASSSALTLLVDAWVKGSKTNKGFILLATGIDNGVATWGTKEGSDGATLLVNYMLPSGGTATGTILSAEPTLVSHGSQIQVRVSLTASQTITNVTASTPLTVTGTNGATASCGSPSPASQTVISSTAAIYTYTCTANTTGVTVLPASLTFQARATGAAGTLFAVATSHSVLVAPPLTFQVTATGAVDPVANRAFVQSSSIISSTPSNRVQSAILASIGDTVWADLDGNGSQTAGEAGLSGVQVCATPSSGGAALCATTDGSGTYRIFSLDSNTNYTVALTPATVPSGYQATSPSSRTVTSGDFAATNNYYSAADYALRPPGAGSIGDTVWLDANENGSLDGSETGLPGVGVRLYRDVTNNGLTGDDILLNTVSTSAGGTYTFTGLYAGTYLVQVEGSSVVTSSYGVTSTIASAMDLVSGTNPRPVTLATDSSSVNTADFGYNWGGRIGDFIWYDDDGNGSYDVGPGESPAPNVTVVLFYDSNGNSKLDAGEPIVDVGASDGSGVYVFDNLPPGNYIANADEQTVESRSTPGLFSSMVATTGTKHPVALTPRQNYTLADFAFIEKAEVEGHIWHDVNSSSVKDTGEPGLGTINISLTGTDTGGTPVNMVTTSNGSGEYKFLVPPGAYSISYSPADGNIPAGQTTQTTPSTILVNVNSGQEVKNLNFGLDNSGAVGDRVWNDADGNGVQNGGEPGLPGVTVQLYASNGTTLLATTVTTASGGYLFSGLADGSYILKIVGDSVPSGYYQTGDPDQPGTTCSTCDGQAAASITGGSEDRSKDFGYRAPTPTFTVSGTIFEDANGNSTDDDGLNITGVEVSLVYTPSGGSPTTLSVTVDGNGDFSVSGLPQGSAIGISVDRSSLPSPAYTATTPPVLTISTLSGPVIGQDFGFQQQFGTIDGTVCDGSTGSISGQCEVNETVLQGITITLRYAGSDGLLNTGDDTTQSVATNASGHYSFANLLPGLYQITETNPAHYGSLADVDGGNPDNISPVTLAAGQSISNQDFEDSADPMTISGGVTHDSTNGDGVADPGEPGIPGVLISLSNGMTTTTDSSGLYTFTLTVPGTYTVTETNPAGYTSTGDVDGGNPDSISVTVSAGQTVTGRDFLDIQPAVITGGVYDDNTNGDGVADPGESGIPAVLISLSNGMTTTTDINGIYTFTLTVPGTYTIVETNPAGYTSTGDTQGANDDQIVVTVSAGQTSANHNFLDWIPHTPTPTATPTHTDTPVATPTHTDTPVATSTHTDTPVATPTHTDTPVATPTHTNTPVATPTHTDTPVATPTHTDTPVATPTHTDTPAATPTHTDTPAATPTHTGTPAATATHTDTPVATPTHTDTPAATATHTDTPAATPTYTDTPSATPTHTDTPTVTPTSTDISTATPTSTDTPTATPSPTDTLTTAPTATQTSSPISTMTPTLTDTPTATHTDSPTATPTHTDTPTATPSPTDTPTTTPTATQTSSPISTMTPTHTNTPTATHTDSPTATPTHTDPPTATPSPTDTLTTTPTATQTSSPTSTMTPTPTPTRTATATALPQPMSGHLIEVHKSLIGQMTNRVIVGQVLAFMIEVVNHSPRTLTLVSVHDKYELDGLEFLGTSIHAPQMSTSGNTGQLFWPDVTLDLGDIPSGSRITFTASFRVAGSGSTMNVASLGEFIDKDGILYPAPRGESAVIVESVLAVPQRTFLPLINTVPSTAISPPCDLYIGCGIDVSHPKGMAYHQGQDALYVVSRDTNRLVKVNGRTGEVLRSAETGREPWDVVINERTGRIYVSNYADGTVWVYAAETLQVVAKLRVGGQPAIMDIFPDLDTVAVAVRGLNGVAFLEGLAVKQLSGTDGTGPYGLAANRVNNELIVTNRDSGTARVFVYRNGTWVLDGPKLEFGHRAVPFEATYNPANGKLYVVYVLPSGVWNVAVFQRQAASQYARLADVRVGDGGNSSDPDVGGTGLLVNPTTGHVFNVNTASDSISVIDGSTNQVIRTVTTGDDPFTLAVNPSTGVVYLALRRGNRLATFLDAAGP